MLALVPHLPADAREEVFSVGLEVLENLRKSALHSESRPVHDEFGELDFSQVVLSRVGSEPANVRVPKTDLGRMLLAIVQQSSYLAAQRRHAYDKFDGEMPQILSEISTAYERTLILVAAYKVGKADSRCRLLSDIVSMAYQIEEVDDFVAALEDVYLDLDAATLHSIWNDSLRQLSMQRRAKLLGSLQSMLSFMPKIGGESAMEQVVQACRKAITWWP